MGRLKIGLIIYRYLLIFDIDNDISAPPPLLPFHSSSWEPPRHPPPKTLIVLFFPLDGGISSSSSSSSITLIVLFSSSSPYSRFTLGNSSFSSSCPSSPSCQASPATGTGPEHFLLLFLFPPIIYKYTNKQTIRY